MKRFVDLRALDTGYRFAWWDTVGDAFERHDGDMAWDTFDEFVTCFHGDNLERYRGLCPAWAFVPPVDDGAERTMTLDHALRVLATVHTRDDEEIGYYIQMGATPHGWECSQNDYITAWKTVRQHAGMTVDPRRDRATGASEV